MSSVYKKIIEDVIETNTMSRQNFQKLKDIRHEVEKDDIEWILQEKFDDNKWMLVEKGFLYLNGKLEADNHPEIKLLINSGRMGNSYAYFILGAIYENIMNDDKEALRYYNLAADDDNPEALYVIAKLYLEGEIVDQSTDKYFELITKASNLGCVDASYELAAYYKIKEKKELFIETLLTAAKLDACAYGKLASECDQKGFISDEPKVLEYAHLGANAGDAGCMIIGSYTILHTTDLKEKLKAIDWFKKASQGCGMFAEVAKELVISTHEMLKEAASKFSLNSQLEELERELEN